MNNIHQPTAFVKDNAKRALVVALGGGGDVIAAYMFSQMLARRGLKPIVVSLAWERLAKDPLPGPRRLRELTGLELLSDYVGRATDQCKYPSGILTNQGALTDHLGMHDNYIVEPAGGVRSVLEGIRDLSRRFPVTEAWGIDVGGDVLADRPLPSLTSPLADAMMLAALTAFDPSARVAVVAPGLDGELPAQIWKQFIRIHSASGKILDWRTFPFETICSIGEQLDLRSLDSEVTAAVVRSYQGLSGTVVMRDSGVLVELGLACLPIAVYRARDMFYEINGVARLIADTESLDVASRRIEEHGYFSELTFERSKALRYEGYPRENASAIAESVLKEIIAAHVSRGADFVAERYISDRLRVNVRSIHDAVDILRQRTQVICTPPFIRLSAGI